MGAAFLVFAGAASAAEDVKHEQGGYVVYLPAETHFAQVVEHELDEFLAQNWEMIKVQDIDDGLRENHNIDVQILAVGRRKTLFNGLLKQAKDGLHEDQAR